MTSLPPSPPPKKNALIAEKLSQNKDLLTLVFSEPGDSTKLVRFNTGGQLFYKKIRLVVAPSSEVAKIVLSAKTNEWNSNKRILKVASPNSDIV